MTIKELSTKLKVSPQAIYKRLRAAGISVEGLKDKETGELTEEGKAAVMALFSPLNQVENSFNQVERIEVERLKAQVETMQAEIDYLRKALDQAQQLQGMALQRMALPAPRHSWWSKLFGKGEQ